MKKILVVDDEMDFLFSFKAFFESKGHKVFVAPRGSDAINFLKQEQPDVMILDLKMKDMNGMDVLRQVKGILPTVKTFIVTGSDDEELRDEAIKLGAVDYITKPIRLGELEKKVSGI